MNSLADRYFAPEVPTRLAALRVLVGLFGTVFLAVRTRYLFDVARLPPQRFDAVGPLWFLDAPLDVHVVQAGVVLAIALGAAFTLGWRHRITGPLYAVLLVVVTTYDNSWQHIAHTENLFALHTLVLGFAPSADAWSLDARRRAGAGATNARHAPAVESDTHENYGWPVRLITAITVCTYALAGWAKMRNGGIDWITGDVLRRDQNGFHYFVGRTDDMFVSGGENIYPTDVEKMLEKHPDVGQAVVIPVDDDIKGTKPVAFVIPKAGRHPTEDAIKSYALKNAPAYQHPRFVWFMDELPLASTNKVDRNALRKLAQERVAGAVPTRVS